ncbi:unnamed protein product, partial [Nesidiocoris tenuis]
SGALEKALFALPASRSVMRRPRVSWAEHHRRHGTIRITVSPLHLPVETYRSDWETLASRFHLEAL